jgi:NitT/TauT family transport system substrate-binding protein
MSTHVQTFFGAAMAALLLAAASGPVAAQSGKPWRHAIIEPKSDAGFFFMPSKGGFTQKQGLNVELVHIRTDSIGLKALIAGELESFEGGAQGAIAAAARGADVKILGCHWVVVPHGVFVRNNINSLRDLKGKSVAVSAPGTFPELVAKAAFEKQGVAYDDVKFAAMGGDSDRYKALVAGVVDGAVVSNEYLPIAAKDGVKQLVAGRDAVPDFIRVCTYSTAKVLAERGADAVKYLTAEMLGLRYALSHRDETIKLTFEISGAKADDPRPAFVFDEAVRSKSIAPELPIPMEKLEAMQKVMVSSGALPKAVDLSKIVDGSVRAKALAAAGM